MNQLNAGWTLTPNEFALKMKEGLPQDWPTKVSRTFAPSGRILSPEGDAWAAVYFLSDEAALINGAILDVEQYPLIGRNPVKESPAGTLSRLLDRLQNQLLHPPIQQLGDVEFILRRAGDFVDPSELLELLARLVQYPALAHMTYVIGSVHLDLKSIRIIELERFL